MKISRRAYNKLLAFALSRTEFCALCGANSKGVIVDAIQIPNRSKTPTITYWWKNGDLKIIIRELENRGLRFYADAHNHPGKYDKLRPSQLDHRDSVPGEIGIIIKSSTQEMGAWRYGRPYRQTLENRLEIVVV